MRIDVARRSHALFRACRGWGLHRLCHLGRCGGIGDPAAAEGSAEWPRIVSHRHPRPCIGAFSTPDFSPLITIDSGDTIVLECLSGGPEVMPPAGSGLTIPPALAAIHAANIPRAPGHLLTGPVGVAGAEPGDMLEVRIDRIEFGSDWGYCGFRPLAGTIPEDFPEKYLSHIPVDRDRKTCRLPWGTELNLAPFFGVMGVAPPPAYGPISTIQPREHGGNLDNKELGEGATFFLPVWAPGALFSAGDGHGVQGDGEVCINALEICLTGTFTLTLHKGNGGSRDPFFPIRERKPPVISFRWACTRIWMSR